MPNHITNILTAPKKVLDALASADSVADFATLIPRPQDVPGDGINLQVTGLAEFICGKIPIRRPSDDVNTLLDTLRLSNAVRDLENGGISALSDKDFDNFISCIRSYRAHKAFYWHDWNCQHWGTKWNAYDVKRVSDTVLRFDTAWSAPHPVIALLALKFPSATIEHVWADEDLGSNLGHRVYSNCGKRDEEIKDPLDFALTVKEHDREGYRVNPQTGLWEYYDADETATCK